jgi:integrase
MTGHVRRRGRNSWELKFDDGRDPATGKRRIRYASVKGTKREAERKLTELLKARDDGSYVEPSKLTVGQHVRVRVDQWESAGAISPKTAERYRELIENQIVPHLGAKLLQKLKPADLETWHTTLKTTGRKDGEGGVSARTIGHAHRILKKALAEAMKNDLIARNAAALQKAPKIEAEEMVILTDNQIKALLPALAGRAIYAPAVVALFSGLRRGELLALRWLNVDLDGKLIRVREALEETKKGLGFKAPKTRNGTRDVALPDLVVDTLRERERIKQRLALGLGKLLGDALVFPGPDGAPQSPRDVSTLWALEADRAGLADVTLHALRIPMRPS